jgi:hypothetical protein
LSGRRSKKPIHDGSQKNELNGYKKIIDASLYIGNIAPDPGKIVCSLHPIENTQIFSAVPCSYGGLFHPGCWYRVLCNAHHLRELERAKDQDQQYWADTLQTFLIELNTQVKDNGGALNQEQADAVRIEYRALLMEGEVEALHKTWPEPNWK